MKIMLCGQRKRTRWGWLSLLLAAGLLLSACGAGTQSTVAGSANNEGTATAEDQARTVVSRTSGPRSGTDEMLYVFQSEKMKEVWYAGDHEISEKPSEDEGESSDAHLHVEQIPVYLLIDADGKVLHQETGYGASVTLLGSNYAFARPAEPEEAASQEEAKGEGKILDRDGGVVAEGVTWAYLAGIRGTHTFLALGKDEGADLVRVTEGGGSQQIYHFDGGMENVGFDRNDDLFAYLGSDGKLLIFDLAALEGAEQGEPVWQGEGVSLFYWTAAEPLSEDGQRHIGALTDAAGQHILRAELKASGAKVTLVDLPEESSMGYDLWTAVKTGEYWGYVDAEGQEVVAPRFYEAQPFYGDVAVVAEIGQTTPEGESEPVYYYYYTAIDREGRDITHRGIAPKDGGEGMQFDSVQQYGGFLMGEREEGRYVILLDGQVKALELSEENLTVDGKTCEVAGVLPEYLAESTLCPVSLTDDLGSGVYYTGLYDFATDAWAVLPEEGAHFRLTGPRFLSMMAGEMFQGKLEENLYVSGQADGSYRFYDMDGKEVPPEDARLANLAIYNEGEEEWGLYWADGSPLYAEERPKHEGEDGEVTAR